MSKFNPKYMRTNKEKRLIPRESNFLSKSPGVVEQGLNEIQQMQYMLERRRQLNMKKDVSQYQNNYVTASGGSFRNRSRQSSSNNRFTSVRQNRASQFQMSNSQNKKQPQLVRTYFRFQKDQSITQNQQFACSQYTPLYQEPEKPAKMIDFSNKRFVKIEPKNDKIISQFASGGSYFKNNNKDQMDVDSQTSDQVSFSSDYHSSGNPSMGSSAVNYESEIQPPQHKKSQFSNTFQAHSKVDDQEEENSQMSNSFEDDFSNLKSKEFSEPISAEKQIERFVGNIAESDDDYDDESSDNGNVIPQKKSSKKANENLKIAQHSYFSKTPIINSEKRVFEDNQSSKNIFKSYHQNQDPVKRKNSHDNAGSSSSDEEQKIPQMIDDSIIDYDVDEDKDRAQKSGFKQDFTINERTSPASISQGKILQTFNQDKIRQGSIDSMFSLQPRVASTFGNNINQQRQNSVFVEDTHMKQIRQIFSKKNQPSSFHRNTPSIANLPNNSNGPHTLSQKSAEASNQNSRNTNTDPSDNGKNTVGGLQSGFANGQSQPPQSKSSSNESQPDLKHNKQKILAQAKTVDEKLQLLYKNQKDVIVTTNLTNLQNQWPPVPTPSKPPSTNNLLLPIYSVPSSQQNSASSVNSSLRANPSKTTPLFTTLEPIGNIGRTNIQGFRQITGMLSSSQSHPTLQQQYQGPEIIDFRSNKQQMNSDVVKFGTFPENRSPMNRENQIMKFTDRIDQKVIDDSGNNLLTDNSCTQNTIQSFNEDSEIFKSQKKGNDQEMIEKRHQQQREDDTSTILELRPFNNRFRPTNQPNNERVRPQNSPPELLLEPSETVEFYPKIIESQKLYSDQFNQQFGEIIGKNLKKKLKTINNISDLQQKYKISPENSHKKTLILALDNCILKTSIFKDELPRIDALFYYQKLKILICFRNDFLAFLKQMSKYYEIVAWQSSQNDYSDQIINIIESTLDFKFDHKLSLSDQNASEDNSYYVKNIDILTGLGGRSPQDIIIIDSQMSNFTNKLTNGIYLPAYNLHEDKNDKMLKSLGHYLMSFVKPGVADVRNKIKVDFDLLTKFNGFKQNQAFMKIAQRTQEESGIDYKQELKKNNNQNNKDRKSGSPQNQNEWYQMYAFGNEKPQKK